MSWKGELFLKVGFWRQKIVFKKLWQYTTDLSLKPLLLLLLRLLRQLQFNFGMKWSDFQVFSSFSRQNLSLVASLTRSLSHLLSISLTRSSSLTLSLSLPLALTRSLLLSLSLSLAPSVTCSHSRSHTFSLSLSCSHSLSLFVWSFFDVFKKVSFHQKIFWNSTPGWKKSCLASFEMFLSPKKYFCSFESANLETWRRYWCHVGSLCSKVKVRRTAE